MDLESIVQSSRTLCVLAGAVRATTQGLAGWPNKPGVHLLVYAEATEQVLCTHPSSEEYRRWLHRLPYVTHLPGGGVEKGETPEAAMKREAEEELKVQLDLQAAMVSELQVPHGRAQNQVTLYIMRVQRPDDFPVGAAPKGEFTAEHQWRSVSDVYKTGNRCFQMALETAGLYPPPAVDQKSLAAE